MKKNLLQSIPSIVLILVILIALIWPTINEINNKTIKTTTLTGELIGFHLHQTHLSSSYSSFTVKLNDGSKVIVTPPSGTKFKKGRIVSILLAIKENNTKYYRFIGYAK